MTIRDNVEKQILDGLGLWIKDSCASCEMAGLSNSQTSTIVMRSLLYALITGLMQKGANKADFIDVVGTNWDIVAEVKASSRLE